MQSLKELMDKGQNSTQRKSKIRDIDRKNLILLRNVEPYNENYTQMLFALADYIINEDMDISEFDNDEYSDVLHSLTKLCLVAYISFLFECCDIGERVLLAVAKMAQIMYQSCYKASNYVDLSKTQIYELYSCVYNAEQNVSPLLTEVWEMIFSSHVELLARVNLSIYIALAKYYDAYDVSVKRSKKHEKAYIKMVDSTILQESLKERITFDDMIESIKKQSMDSVSQKVSATDSECRKEETDDRISFVPSEEKKSGDSADDTE